MEVSAYVGQRILFKYWDCVVVKNIKYETAYKELDEYYQIFKDFGFDELSKIKIEKRSDMDVAIYDLKKVYVDLTKEVDNFHSLRNLRLMFVATKLFINIYKDNPIISAHIVFVFQTMSHRSKCWTDLMNRYDQNDRLCILV